MRRITAVLLSLLLVSALLVPAFAADYYVALKCSSDKVRAGETVKIDVDISEGLSGVDIIITYDTDKFEFVGGKYSELMMSFANEAQYGTVHIAAVASQAAAAGTLYSFELRVLSNGGKIIAHVREALEAYDNDVSSTMKDTTITVKASGTAERMPTTVPAVTPEEAQSASGGEGAAPQSGSASAGSTQTVTAEDNAETPSVISGSAASEESGSAELTQEEELAREKDSRTGLIAAICVGTVSLCLVAALILFKIKKGKDTQDKKTEQND